jgi:hypothetical protein
MSRAWFALAVAAVLGLFYVGYGQEVKVKPIFQQPAQPMAARMKWETLSVQSLRGSPPPQVQRTKIPGGWLVETSRRGESGTGVGLAFVPDPDHKWDGNSVP